MDELTWLEVSLQVNGELAEAVAEVLARFAPDGVVIESTAIQSTPEDEGYPVGPMRVYAYLPVDSRLEETRRRLEESLWYLGRISPLPPPKYQTLVSQNWMESWKQNFHPIQVGERLVVLPAWVDTSPPGRIPLRIDPGMAFGTGTHPTTRLCLELVEAYTCQEDTVIDLGCGSGILAIAALALGARHALAVDIDPQAISAASQNAALNQLSSGLELGVGSLDEIRSGAFSTRQARLVFANLLAPLLVRLLDEGLSDLFAPGGVGIFSGILAEQEPSVADAIARHGLFPLRRLQSGDWVALTAGR